MPWEHCGNSVADDQAVCPECGASKASWTMAFNQTRMFKLGRAWEGDPAAQADALKNAADGSPFCEECTAAANADQDSEAEEEDDDEEEAEADSDTEAQAEGLKDAADSGSPFCEECTKAANEEDQAA